MHSHQQSRPALNPAGRFSAILLLYSLCVTQAEAAEAVFPSEVPLFARLEVSLDAKGSYSNPYVEVAAEATLIEPNGGSRCQVPLFWDGGSTWRFRFSPDKPGLWRWSVSSGDAGLNGREGRFECVPSELRGGLQPAAGWPAHFSASKWRTCLVSGGHGMGLRAG
ncbi:MAG: DUF5060 domain-containing protein [Opitutaceae bacterium]|nr:DUF5060 domain-containing protein [Opitutaceae bacterium]